jgi:hypothetical protein
MFFIKVAQIKKPLRALSGTARFFQRSAQNQTADVI